MRKDSIVEQENDVMVRYVPSGTLTALAFAIAGGCFFYMSMILVPELATRAQAILPDVMMRPVYDQGYLSDFVLRLGEDGRARFLMPYLALDFVFAISFAAGLCMGSLRLLSRIRGLTGKMRTILPALAVMMPILAGLFDLWENITLYSLMSGDGLVTADQFHDLIRATRFKVGFYVVAVVAFIMCILMGAVQRKKVQD